MSRDARSLWQRLVDRWSTSGGRGARVRILPGDAAPVVTGSVPGVPRQKLLAEVLDLGPDGAGTIDVAFDAARGCWTVRTAGPLADPRFEQRLRNVLGNGL